MTILPVAPTATTTRRSPLDKKLRSSVSHDTASVPTAPTTASDKMLYMPAANEKRNSRKGCNPRFKDRHDAGQQLSELLTYYSDKEAVVLAVPNNGVPIAYEISSHLRLPLRCFLFETIRRVEHPELYLGAISEPEGTLVKNQEIIESLNIGEREFQDLANEARSRLKQKTSEYCQAAVKPSTLAGKRVILVLDIEDAKSPALVRLIVRLLVSQTKGEPPKDLVVATPVISPDTIKMVKPHTGHAEGFVFDGSLQWVGVENDNFIGKNDDYYEDSESVTAEGVAHIIDIAGANCLQNKS